jgi:hypothetical protein
MIGRILPSVSIHRQYTVSAFSDNRAFQEVFARANRKIPAVRRVLTRPPQVGRRRDHTPQNARLGKTRTGNLYLRAQSVRKERGCKMNKGFKERITFEVLMILIVLVLLCLITRIWPLVFLVVPGILIAALRLLFLSAKKKTDVPIPAAAPPEPPRAHMEQDVIRIAFGILQCRVAEQVASHYPAARWVWEVPNAMDCFARDMPLTILLSRAGGFAKAAVQVHNLRLCGLVYETAETDKPDEPPPDADTDGDGEDAPETDGAVDYALIAFQWAEANLLALNGRCNESIANGETILLIQSHDLPHPDSWPEICAELTRNGFAGAEVEENGILVTIPK